MSLPGSNDSLNKLNGQYKEWATYTGINIYRFVNFSDDQNVCNLWLWPITKWQMTKAYCTATLLTSQWL